MPRLEVARPDRPPLHPPVCSATRTANRETRTEAASTRVRLSTLSGRVIECQRLWIGKGQRWCTCVCATNNEPPEPVPCAVCARRGPVRLDTRSGYELDV